MIRVGQAISIIPLLWCFADSPLSAQQPSPRALVQVVKSFRVEKASFEDALKELIHTAGDTFGVGFESAGPAEPRIVGLSLENVNVAEALGALCAQDRRYTYTEARPGLIEIRPIQEPPVLKEMLNLHVRQVDLAIREWPMNIFARAPQFVPELGEYLTKKALDWAKCTGESPMGSPGVSMRTNIAPPLFSISTGNTTVRGVLNALAAHTLAPATSSGASQTGPVGWRVEFIPDSRAPTGFGGYVRWSAFP